MIFTRRQTAGRGQWGRSWYSPPGVLTASLVVNQPWYPHRGWVSVGAGLAIIYALEDLCPELTGQLRLKWPNDIWLQDRKLCGLLIEAIAPHADRPGRFVIGIGCNCAVDFSENNNAAASSAMPVSIKNAISLHEVIQNVPDELILLSQFRHQLLELMSFMAWQAANAIPPTKHLDVTKSPPPGFNLLLPEINRRDYLRDRPLEVITSQHHYQGWGAGIDPWGYLRLRLTKGDIIPVSSGQIIFSPKIEETLDAIRMREIAVK